MKYLVNELFELDWDDPDLNALWEEQIKEYNKYFEQVKPYLPKELSASYDLFWNHDSKIKNIKYFINNTGYQANIIIELEGKEKKHEIEYINVGRCKIDLKNFTITSEFLYSEILLTKAKKITHEIITTEGNVFICCEKIEYRSV